MVWRIRSKSVGNAQNVKSLKLREKAKEYYQENKDKKKVYNEQTRETRLEKKKEYRETHPEQIASYSKEYRKRTIVCPHCSTIITLNNKATHEKTKKHQNNLKTQEQQEET